MISTLLITLFSIFFDQLAILRISKSDKDLEIIILRQQVRILQRKAKTPPRISDPERMVLATLLDKYCKFKDGAHQHLNQVMMIFKPDTVLRWHRELVRRKWTFKRKGKPALGL
jgi:putative transposase